MTSSEWRPLAYSSPGLYRPFQLCRQIHHGVWRVTLPMSGAFCIDLYDAWRPV